VSGADRSGDECSTADDSSTSERSFTGNLVAATGDVTLLRDAAITPSLVTSPRRIAGRDLADMTLS